MLIGVEPAVRFGSGISAGDEGRVMRSVAPPRSNSRAVEAPGLFEADAPPVPVTANGSGVRRQNWTGSTLATARTQARRQGSDDVAPFDVNALSAWDAPENEAQVVVRVRTQEPGPAVPGADEILRRAFGEELD
jgi:hypothetical protein